MTLIMNMKTGEITDDRGNEAHIGKNCLTVYCENCKIASSPAYHVPCQKCGGETTPVIFINTIPYLVVGGSTKEPMWTLELEALEGTLEFLNAECGYGWINTGLKPEWEFMDGVKASDDGMRFDNPYLYQPPKIAPEGLWAQGIFMSTDEELERKANIFQEYGERDYPECRDLENGNYWNTCSECGMEFIGHKRMTVCKLCKGRA